MSLENPSPYEIQEILAAWNNAREELLRHDPDPDAYATETAALAETEKARDLVVRLVRASQRAEAMYKAADAMATDLEIRARRYQKRFERFRKTALDIMMIVGRTKLEEPDFTFYQRRGQEKVEVTGEVDEEFIRTKIIREPDKPALFAALKAGRAVKNAHLSNGPPHAVLDTR
jgi:hypothetical protein